MRIPFRQGIVRCLEPGFLTVGSSYVSLNVVDTPLLLAIAHGSINYLFIEQQSAVNAWGPITPNVDQWLYWDINPQTATRTFGITLLRPVVQSTPPTDPQNDQHWFDTSTTSMKYWKTQVNRWIDCIRVFACELNDGAVPLSVSIESPHSFKGTQVGLTQACLAGTILFDLATGKPLRTIDNKFLTSETKLQASTGTTSNIKAEAILIEAEAQESLPAYTIVKFVDFGKIAAADQFTASTTQQFGIVEADATIGDIVNVTTSGVISCATWSWPAVNTLLYADAYGQLTPMSVGAMTPVGIVIDTNKILLYATPPGAGAAGGTSGPATVDTLGSIKLSVPAVNPQYPIAVGDNDPRVTQALSRTGGNMLGPLTLSTDPTQPFDAATKQYVDLQIATSGTTHAKTNGDIQALTIGTPVYSISKGSVAQASAVTSVASSILGITTNNQVDVGTIGQFQTSGLLTANTGQWDVVTGTSGGLIEGAKYYLSITPGKITTAPPSTPGRYVAYVGIAVSSTQMFINIQASILL